VNPEDLQAIQSQLERLEFEVEQELTQAQLQRKLYDMHFLHTQKRYLDAINSPEYFIVGVLSANQWGKSWIHMYDLISESLGYEPHSGCKRPRTAYDLALLLPDYDNHARKVLHQNLYHMLPKECVHVEQYTQNGAPRVLYVTDPVTGVRGKSIHIFTHDQDPMRLEGATWQRIGIDEPCPRSHFTALVRGLQKTGGKVSMTLTPITEAWIFDDLYSSSHVNGGTRRDIAFFTAHPEENRQSMGGFLPDRQVDAVRDTYPEEEKEARIHGRFLHLVGRVYKEFQEDTHVVDPDDVQEMIAQDPSPLYACVVDPHDRIPWAISWTYIDRDHTYFTFREFPTDPFERIHSHGYTYDHYAQVLLQGSRSRYRIMDPNAGRRRLAVTGRTVAEELAIRSRPGNPLGFDTTVSDDLQAGHQAVRERLHPYDNRGGSPKLFITSDCRNHITSLRNYTWDEYRGRTAEGRERKQKPRERFKHFADTLRYLCMYPITRGAVANYERPPLLQPVWMPRQLHLPNRQYEQSPWHDLHPDRPDRGRRRYHGRI
jgi:hypothetical protein